jgi:hypothetical protein
VWASARMVACAVYRHSREDVCWGWWWCAGIRPVCGSRDGCGAGCGCGCGEVVAVSGRAAEQVWVVWCWL